MLPGWGAPSAPAGRGPSAACLSKPPSGGAGRGPAAWRAGTRVGHVGAAAWRQPQPVRHRGAAEQGGCAWPQRGPARAALRESARRLLRGRAESPQKRDGAPVCASSFVRRVRVFSLDPERQPGGHGAPRAKGIARAVRSRGRTPARRLPSAIGCVASNQACAPPLRVLGGLGWRCRSRWRFGPRASRRRAISRCACAGWMEPREVRAPFSSLGRWRTHHLPLRLHGDGRARGPTSLLRPGGGLLRQCAGDLRSREARWSGRRRPTFCRLAKSPTVRPPWTSPARPATRFRSRSPATSEGAEPARGASALRAGPHCPATGQ